MAVTNQWSVSFGKCLEPYLLGERTAVNKECGLKRGVNYSVEMVFNYLCDDDQTSSKGLNFAAKTNTCKKIKRLYKL